MAELDSDEAQYWHNKGEQDAAEGRVEMIGGPRQSFFETEAHYEATLEAYRDGRENHYNQLGIDLG